MTEYKWGNKLSPPFFKLIFIHIFFLQIKLKENQDVHMEDNKCLLKSIISNYCSPPEIPLSSTFFPHFCNIQRGGFDRNDIVVLGQDWGVRCGDSESDFRKE